MALLLCGLASVAPLIARSIDPHHPRSHVVRVLAAAAADQHTSTVRLDQPGTTEQPVRESARPAAATRPDDPIALADVHAADSVRTRGPPTSLR